MKKKVKLLFLFLLFSLPLLYFLFTLFFFRPFEEDYGRIENIVPRRVDLFLRKKDLEDDFYAFPVPKFYTDLEVNPRWRIFARTDLYRELEEKLDVAGLVKKIRADLEALPFIDLVHDVIGREVAVAAELRNDREGLPFSYMLFFRGTWKVKLLYETLAWDLLRRNAGDPLIAESSMITDPLGYRTLLLPDGREFYMRRLADVVVVGDDEEIMQEVCELVNARGASMDLSIGGSEGFIRKVSSVERVEPEYLDFHVDLPKLLEKTTFDEAWRANQEDFSVMTAMQIFDPAFFQSLTGSLHLDRFLDLDAFMDFDVGQVEKARTGFFGRESVPLDDRLHFLASMLPDDVFFAGFFSVDLKRLLQIMDRNLDPELRKLMGSLLREGQRFNRRWRVKGGLPDLIDTLDATFGDEVFVALRPRDVDKPIVPGVQPVPIIAVVLEIKDMGSFKEMEYTVREMQDNNTSAFELWQCKALQHNCRIKGINTPGAEDIEKIAYTVMDDRYFILATSDDFIVDMLDARAAPNRSLERDPRFQPARSFLKGPGNLAFYLEIQGLKDALSNYAEYWGEIHSLVDYRAERVKAREEVIRRRFPKFAGRQKLPADVEKEVEKLVDVRMTAIEKQRQEQDVPRLAKEFRRYLDWLGLLRSVELKVNVNRNNLDLGLRICTVL